MGADPAKKIDVKSPADLTAAHWIELFRRVLVEIGRDNVALLAAGVAFFGLLAVFPALASLVAFYRLFGDPNDIGAQIAAFRGLAPGPVLDLVHEQLLRFMATPSNGIALQGALNLLLALWASQQGVRSFLRGLNIAYGNLTRRKFVRRTTLGLGFSIAAIAVAGVTIAAFTFAPLLIMRFGAPGQIAHGLFQWPTIMLIVTVFALALYRWGPNRQPPAWMWLLPGAALAAAGWIAASAALTFYAQTFVDYGRIYGSVASAVLLLLWLFLSTYAFLVGAELNAELEACCAD